MAKLSAFPVIRPVAKYNRNLIPFKWTFDVDATTFTTVAGAGAGNTSNDDPYDGLRCLKLANSDNSNDYIAGMTDPVLFESDSDGRMILSFQAKNPTYNVTESEGFIRMKKNGVAFNDYAFKTVDDSDEPVFDQWLGFAISLDLIKGDTIEIQYGIYKNLDDGVPTDAFIYFGGFQLELDDRGLGGIPTIYSPPIATE